MTISLNASLFNDTDILEIPIPSGGSLVICNIDEHFIFNYFDVKIQKILFYKKTEDSEYISCPSILGLSNSILALVPLDPMYYGYTASITNIDKFIIEVYE